MQPCLQVRRCDASTLDHYLHAITLTMYEVIEWHERHHHCQRTPPRPTPDLHCRDFYTYTDAILSLAARARALLPSPPDAETHL